MGKLFIGFFKNPNYELLENDNTFTVDTVKEIFKVINSKIKHDKNVGKKFERRADEIEKSGTFNGCTEYATVFEEYTRASGIPTVHVIAAKNDWIRAFQKNEAKSYHPHHFCECYLSGKWVLIDPCGNAIPYEDYNKEDLNIKSGSGSKYYVYAKCYNIFELDDFLNENFSNQKNMLRKHNALMRELFESFDIGRLKDV